MITLFCVRPKGFNIGNDAIALGLQYFLSQAFGQVVNIINLPATSRYESQAKAGLTSKTIHEMNQFGHGVIVGGGNLYENGELDVNLDALKTLEIPLMLFSLSRGRIYNRNLDLVNRTDAMPDRVIKALNDKASYSLTRDGATHAYLESIGVTKSEVGGCPTIFLDRMVSRLPQLSTTDRSGTLISIRNPSLMNIPLYKQSQVYGDVAEMIKFLRSEGHTDIRLLCHDHRDIDFAASFVDVDYVYTDDLYTYLALLRSCALNISYRLHASLPCFAFGTPTIEICYDERSASLNKTIGYGDWIINMVEEDDLVGTVIDHYRHLDDLPGIHTSAQPVWGDLYDKMLTTCRDFAHDVHQIQQSLKVRSGVNP